MKRILPIMLVFGLCVSPVMAQAWAQTQNSPGPVSEKAPAIPVTVETLFKSDAPMTVRVDHTGTRLMSLQDTVSEGLYVHPEYGIIANNRRASDELLRQAQGLYFPSIDMRGDAGFEYSDHPLSRMRTAGSEALWRYGTGVTLTQMLFDGQETYYENQRRQFHVLAAANRVREVSELVALAIADSYLDVMRQRELLALTRGAVETHVVLLEQIGDAAATGHGPQSDVELVRARLAALRAAETGIREALRHAEAAFIRQVGRKPQDLLLPEIPSDVRAGDVEDAVIDALSQSPALAAYQAEIDAAHAEYEAAKAAFYPTLDLQVGSRGGYNIDGLRGRDTSASALMVVNWNLYRGGIDNARVRERIAREAQAKQTGALARRDMEADIRQTWARMESAAERGRQFTAQAEAAAGLSQSYRGEFSQNRRALSDILDVEGDLLSARSQAINAVFLEKLAAFRLLALKGQLLPTLGIPSPREADPGLR